MRDFYSFFQQIEYPLFCVYFTITFLFINEYVVFILFSPLLFLPLSPHHQWANLKCFLNGNTILFGRIFKTR